MKIGKIFSSSLSVLFSLSCFSTFGMESTKKEKCLNCFNLSSDYILKPLFSNCNLTEYSYSLCKQCFNQFNRLNGGYFINPARKNFKELEMIQGNCVFCHNDYETLMQLVNSNLSRRAKSFIYRVALRHDKQNGTKFCNILYATNPDYYDSLEMTNICADSDDETFFASEFYHSEPYYQPLEKYVTPEPRGKCRVCSKTKILNFKSICKNEHKGVICERCLDKILESKNAVCPVCNTKITPPKPLPDEMFSVITDMHRTFFEDGCC